MNNSMISAFLTSSIVFTLLLCLFIPIHLQAQGCDNMAYFKEGQTFEISNYNKKGKLDSYTRFKTENINHSGARTTATLQSEQFDKKGKSIINTECEFICANNLIEMDMSALMYSAIPAQTEGVEVTITQDNVGIPTNAKVGTELEDGSFVITTQVASIKMSTTIDMVDRKVAGQEKVTTPAGTFDCLKITYTNKIKAGFMKKSTDMVVYMNPEYGMIRNEMYERGKRTGHSELTKID